MSIKGLTGRQLQIIPGTLTWLPPLLTQPTPNAISLSFCLTVCQPGSNPALCLYGSTPCPEKRLDRDARLTVDPPAWLDPVT